MHCRCDSRRKAPLHRRARRNTCHGRGFRKSGTFDMCGGEPTLAQHLLVFPPPMDEDHAVGHTQDSPTHGDVSELLPGDAAGPLWKRPAVWISRRDRDPFWLGPLGSGGVCTAEHGSRVSLIHYVEPAWRDAHRNCAK